MWQACLSRHPSDIRKGWTDQSNGEDGKQQCGTELDTAVVQVVLFRGWCRDSSGRLARCELCLVFHVLMYTCPHLHTDFCLSKEYREWIGGKYILDCRVLYSKELNSHAYGFVILVLEKQSFCSGGGHAASSRKKFVSSARDYSQKHQAACSGLFPADVVTGRHFDVAEMGTTLRMRNLLLVRVVM